MPCRILSPPVPMLANFLLLIFERKLMPFWTISLFLLKHARGGVGERKGWYTKGYGCVQVRTKQKTVVAICWTRGGSLRRPSWIIQASFASSSPFVWLQKENLWMIHGLPSWGGLQRGMFLIGRPVWITRLRNPGSPQHWRVEEALSSEPLKCFGSQFTRR